MPHNVVGARELKAHGVVTRPTTKGLAPFRPTASREPLSTAVLEDREDRF